MKIGVAGTPAPGWEYATGTDFTDITPWYQELADLGNSFSIDCNSD